MKSVGFSHKGQKQACVRYAIHRREKPLREERSGGPSFRVPAYFIHGGSACSASVISKDWRTTRPTGSPARRETWRRRSSRSLGSRTVNVLPIRHDCNTQGRLQTGARVTPVPTAELPARSAASAVLSH